jgi:hypothetical protein
LFSISKKVLEDSDREHNSVNSASIEAEFFDHKTSVPFYEGWEQSLKAHYKPIPAIDGGYTRGHFFEFADGKVTIRDMINTEPFYVHSYITEDTAGIIKENLLRRIFGNVPFESATLADIKFSKVPPRPWDMKKLSSFKEKFFSIPAEYQSYYPQVDGCQQIDQNLSKKKGRPRVEDIESSDSFPTQKVLGRKKTPVPLSAFNSNSLLKYFGPKVAAALACPSRSMHVKFE